jgi:hypothetical protein
VHKLIISIACICCISACTQIASNQKNNMEHSFKQYQEGKDYLVLKRFRVTDTRGFYQPVEASSFLLPANWLVNSDIQWNGLNKCIPEMVQASLQAKSPDGEYELFVFPVTQFDWSDDPIYLDAMQKGFNMHSCNIARPLDATGYIGQALAPYIKAQAKTVKPVAELQQQMEASAMQMTNTSRTAGNYAYSHRGSAAEGILQCDNGKEGIAICTIMQTIVTMPGTQGGMVNTYQCYVSMRTVLKYKSGNESTARKILSTFLGSAKINPLWANAVQNFFVAIGKNAQDQTWKQIQISHQAQQEISNNIVRSWETKNNNNPGENNNEQFGQYLRGVDSWTDENGNKIELTSGYNNAWSKGDGTYLLSDNPAFDPNVAFNEDWKPLKK